MKKRRVLLVLEAAGGGAGRHVTDLAAGLVDRDYDVTVAYSPARAEPGFLERLNRMTGVATVEISMSRSIGPGDFASLYRLWRVVREMGPFDVLHGHSSKAGALVRLLPFTPGRRFYTPHAFRTMDPTLGRMKAAFYWSAEWALAKLGNAVTITVSNDERDHAARMGFDPRRTATVLNGILRLEDDRRKKWRDVFGLRDDEFCIGFVGRLVHQKAPERLVASFSRLAGRHTGLRLVLIGDGELEEGIRSSVHDLGLDGRVGIFKGVDGQQCMAAFDLFVMPSRYEAMPYVLIEALSVGLPIVATRVGGATTAVEDGVNGRIVENASNPAPLAEAIEAYVVDRDMHAAHSRASMKRFAQFDLSTMIDRTVALYETTAPGRQSEPDVDETVATERSLLRD